MSIAESVAKFERKMIRMALTQNQFKIVRTANQLKLTRHALRYRMQKLGLNTIRNGEDSGELDMSFTESVAKFERKIIRMALTQNQFSIVRTAKQLKLARHALHYRMQKLGLNTIRNGEDSGEENNGRI